MYCPKCAGENLHTALRCIRCGESLVAGYALPLTDELRDVPPSTFAQFRENVASISLREHGIVLLILWLKGLVSLAVVAAISMFAIAPVYLYFKQGIFYLPPMDFIFKGMKAVLFCSLLFAVIGWVEVMFNFRESNAT